MFVEITHPDDSTTGLFGVADFHIEAGIHLYFHAPSPVGEQRKRTEEGQVVAAASESDYNQQAAYETMRDMATQDDTEIVVVCNDLHPWVTRAAEELREEDDFDGDLEIET